MKRIDVRIEINRLLMSKDYINKISYRKMNAIITDFNFYKEYIKTNTAPSYLVSVVNDYERALFLIHNRLRTEKINKLKNNIDKNEKTQV